MHLAKCPNAWGSVGTTHQGKRKVSRKVRVGQARRGHRERPMGTATYGGKGFKGRARVSGKAPIKVLGVC